jgi:putative phage-type endonuclease
MHERVRALLQRCEHLPAQHTPEWYRARDGMITASEVGSVLGTNPYTSRTQLLRTKAGVGKPFTGNAATQWGTANEEQVRDRFCAENGEVCHETGCIPHATIPFLGASPDGILESGALLEIKCPLRREPVRGVENVPPYYMSQMQLQMEVCDLDRCYFVEWKPSHLMFGDDTFAVTLVERDFQWLERNLPCMQAFWDDVQRYRADPVLTESLRAPPRTARAAPGSASGPQFRFLD